MEPLPYLRSHPILGLAEDGPLQTLAEACQVLVYAPGAAVVRPGSPHTQIFAVCQGVIEVSGKNREAKTQMLMGLMEAPGIFGDAELNARAKQ